MIALLLPLATRLVGERFAKLAAWSAVLLTIGLLIYAAYCWAWDRGRDHERARWEAAAAKLEKADAVADEKARDVAAETKGKIDEGNKRAADAAASSDDPLGAAFRSLRGQGARQADKASP
jgi:Flp pilus assembly protein TadB